MRRFSNGYEKPSDREVPFKPQKEEVPMAVIEKPYGLTINEAVGMCLEVYRDDVELWRYW